MDVDLILRNGGALMNGVGVTLAITLVGVTIAILGGSLVCAMRISSSGILRACARSYILFFRVTPEVILIFWAYYCIPLIFQATVSGFWSGSAVLGLIGAAYLAVICLIPELLISQAGMPFYFGGTSLLIVVSVTMDTVAQIHGHLQAHQYEGLVRKAKLRGRKK